MQTEVEEVYEPYHPGRGSSSTMPQKRNPISCVYITAQTGVVRSLVGSLLNAMEQDHERATGQWEIEWIVLPEIFVLSAGCLAQTKFLVSGLQVDEKRMRANLDITKGLIVSEAVMMGLGPALGRQYAHDLVYDICREVVKTGRPLADLLAENGEIKKHMSKAELQKLCDPANYLARPARWWTGCWRCGRASRPAKCHASGAFDLPRPMRFSTNSNLGLRVSHECHRRIHRQRAPGRGVQDAARPQFLRPFRRRRERSEGTRPDPLRGGFRDPGRLPEIQVQRDRRGHQYRRALGDRGQDRGHSAGRGRPPHREVDHQAGGRWRRDQGHLFGGIRRWRASSAASASRCFAPRPRTWKNYSRSGCAPPSRKNQPEDK